ncbi:MAG: 30S ribosomal protein S14 [Flexibacter sp. CG_4_10_14_3_um_filter_32_15]|nr:MAG: 30S ribosomal protein S14 [Flexibacter sp. CG_4_10_14_3_um_filter_32_15]
MAKSSMIARERKRQKMVEKYAEKRVELKKLAKNGDVEAQIALDKLPKDSSPVRLHNRCRLTGRPRGYMRRFGICRVVFREMANDGKIPGVTKSSW